MAELIYTEGTEMTDVAQLRDQLTARVLPAQRVSDALAAAWERRATAAEVQFASPVCDRPGCLMTHGDGQATQEARQLAELTPRAWPS